MASYYLKVINICGVRSHFVLDGFLGKPLENGESVILIPGRDDPTKDPNFLLRFATKEIDPGHFVEISGMAPDNIDMSKIWFAVPESLIGRFRIDEFLWNGSNLPIWRS
jgi:hypothetical protein